MKAESREKDRLLEESQALRRQVEGLERRLAEALAFNQTIIDTSSLGILAYDAQGQCILANEASARMVGGTQAQLLRQNFHHLPSWQQSGLLAAAQKALATGREERQEIYVVSTFGKEVWLDCRFVTFISHGEPHLLLLLDEITARKQAEALLQQSREELEARVQERTRELCQVNAELHREIDERRLAEAALRESERRYSSLFANNHAVMLLIDPETAAIVDANPAACSFYGLSRAELTSRKITDIDTLTPDQVFEEMHRARSRERQVFQFRHRLADGAIREVEVFSGPIEVQGRQLLYSIVHDITERKEAEAARQESEERFRLLVDQSFDGIFVHEDFRIVDLNQQMVDITGYSRTELLSMRAIDLFTPESQERILDYIRSGKTGYFDLQLQRKDGRFIAVESFGAPCTFHGRQARIVGIRDITERQQAEAALRQSEARFRELAENILEVFWVFDWQKQQVLYVSPAYSRVWGRSVQALYDDYREWAQSIHPDDAPHAQESFRQILTTGGGEPREYRIIRPDGSVRWVSDRGFAVRGENGTIERIVGIAEDITARKQAEEALRAYQQHLERLVAERTEALTRVNEQLLEKIDKYRRAKQALSESEMRLRKIFEGAPFGICLRDTEGRFLEVNPAFSRMLGYSREELLAMNMGMITHPEDEPSRQTMFHYLMAGRTEFFDLTLRFFRKDNTLRCGHWYVALLRGPEGAPLYSLGMLQDITREKQAEEELALYQENLRSLASELSLTEERERRRLAEFLHDEIGQILALTKIKLGGLQRELPSPHLHQQANEVRDFLDEAIRLTRNLTFELSLPILYEMGLEEAVEWLAEQFQKEYGIAITVNHDSQPTPLTEGARVLLFRIVRELLTNVVKHARARHAGISFTKEGEHLHIRLTDDGIGFEVGEQFYPMAAAMSGFGLFSVRERLSHLGGILDVNSSPGQGTRVTIIVPLRKTEEFSPVW